MENTPKIFLSYAHEDQNIIGSFYSRLQDEGFSPWMDRFEIKPGDNWTLSIRRAMSESEIVLLFLSEKSVSKRGYLHQEIEVALQMAQEKKRKKPFLIPIRIDESPYPEKLLHIQYANLQTDRDWQMLIHDLRELTREHTSIFNTTDALPETHTEKTPTNNKPKIFVAMPFDVTKEDVFHYAIKNAASAHGFDCIRMDMLSFTGDILDQIKEKIGASVAVIAELSDENPNVHLELGYAWGKGIPTILLLPEGQQLCFDVRGQKCLTYLTIKGLEESLLKELGELKADLIKRKKI